MLVVNMRKQYHTSSQHREKSLNRSSRPRRSSLRSSQPAGKSNTSITVRDHDVKAGKGHGSTSHPGNQYYLQRVQEQKVFYRNQESNKGKTAVAKVIIEMIECRGGRFVEEINGKWEIIPSDRVERKVKQALRDMSASTSSSLVVKKTKNEVQSNSNSISETDDRATSNMNTLAPESSQNQVLNNISSPSIAIEEKMTASTCRGWKPQRKISSNVRTEQRNRQNTGYLDSFHNECEQRISDEDGYSKAYTNSKCDWRGAKPCRQPSPISSLNTDAVNGTILLDRVSTCGSGKVGKWGHASITFNCNGTIESSGQGRCTQSGISPLNRSEMEEMMINLRGNSMDDDIDKDDDDVLLPIDDSVWDT